MSRAEKFIRDCIRNCSNEIIVPTQDGNSYTNGYTHWLTPDQARKAVEIAREEIYDWLENNLSLYNACDSFLEKCRLLKNLKEVMKDE